MHPKQKVSILLHHVFLKNYLTQFIVEDFEVNPENRLQIQSRDQTYPNHGQNPTRSLGSTLTAAATAAVHRLAQQHDVCEQSTKHEYSSTIMM